MNAKPSIRDGYEDVTPVPYDQAYFWWHVDRCDETREIRALGRRLGLDVTYLTNEQVAESIWRVVP